MLESLRRCADGDETAELEGLELHRGSPPGSTEPLLSEEDFYSLLQWTIDRGNSERDGSDLVTMERMIQLAVDAHLAGMPHHMPEGWADHTAGLFGLLHDPGAPKLSRPGCVRVPRPSSSGGRE